MSRRLVTLALVLCLMFLVSTTNPLITSEFSTDEENTQATSGPVSYTHLRAHET